MFNTLPRRSYCSVRVRNTDLDGVITLRGPCAAVVHGMMHGLRNQLSASESCMHLLGRGGFALFV